MGTKQDIAELTALLRNSADPLWARLRHVLREHGVATESAVLATSFPDDTSFEFGVIVTSDRRVYQFGLDYLDQPVEHGKLTEWVDLTDRHATSRYREEVALALELLEAS